VAEGRQLDADCFAQPAHAAGDQRSAMLVLCHLLSPCASCRFRRRSYERHTAALNRAHEKRVSHRSTAKATPMPPPMHNDARPFFALRRPISWRSETNTRQPDAPIGWPSAIAPPLTLMRLVSQPISLLTAHACAAKASLISMRSSSDAFQPAFSRQRREAGTGPMPMIEGSTPDEAKDLILARGFNPSPAARSALITRTT